MTIRKKQDDVAHLKINTSKEDNPVLNNDRKRGYTVLMSTLQDSEASGHKDPHAPHQDKLK